MISKMHGVSISYPRRQPLLRVCKSQMLRAAHLSRDQNSLVGNPLAHGGKEFAVSKSVGFVSYHKQNRSACCAASAVSSNLGFPTLPL